MNNIFIRSKINIKRINSILFLSILPLLIHGFYKNGIKLYSLKLITFTTMLKPLLFDLLGILIGILVNFIYEKIIKKNSINFKYILFSSFHPLYGLLIASIISINTNILLFIIITFAVLFISKFINNTNVNVIALSALIIILLSNIIGTFSYLNIYESKMILTLNGLDYLIGRGSGGINATNVILLTISLIILMSQKWYKKEIFIYSITSFLVFVSIYLIINNNIGTIFETLFSNGILFSYIFIAPDSLTSCYTAKGKIIYGTSIGIITFILYLIYPPLSSLGAILLMSIINKLIDRICAK